MTIVTFGNASRWSFEFTPLVKETFASTLSFCWAYFYAFAVVQEGSVLAHGAFTVVSIASVAIVRFSFAIKSRYEYTTFVEETVAFTLCARWTNLDADTFVQEGPVLAHRAFAVVSIALVAVVGLCDTRWRRTAIVGVGTVWAVCTLITKAVINIEARRNVCGCRLLFDRCCFCC